jgi:hypothetical protein
LRLTRCGVIGRPQPTGVVTAAALVLSDTLCLATSAYLAHHSCILVSGTIKKGLLSKNRKNRLDLVKIETKRRPPANPHLIRGSAGPPRPPRTISGLGPERNHEASDKVPILRLARGPARKASDEVPILRLARGRLGNNPVASALTDFSDRTSHPTNASNYSRDVSRTTARYSGVADEMGVTSTPCRPGQDGAGVTSRCARHCAHD